MKTLVRITCAAVTSFALGFGCGGDSGGGGGGGTSGGNTKFSSGLDGKQELGSLSAADTAKFCAAAANFAKSSSVGPDLCKIAALFVAALMDPKSDAEAQMLCQQGYSQCLSSPSMNMCKDPPTGCKATVADAEACWNASIAYLDSATAAIPACNKVTLKDLQASAGGGGQGATPAKPDACKPLDTVECSPVDPTSAAE